MKKIILLKILVLISHFSSNAQNDAFIMAFSESSGVWSTYLCGGTAPPTINNVPLLMDFGYRNNSFSQDTTLIKKHKNEFGVDVTALLQQFFNFSGSPQFPNYYYSVPYYLTYRRHFKKSNIRFGIGGTYSSNEINAAFQLDSNKYESTSHELGLRVGYEFFSDLSKKWQVFYGMDLKYYSQYDKNDAPYWNGGYANGREMKSEIYNIGPLLGFRFKINDRLSLLTETSIGFNYQKNTDRKYYIPVTSQYPPLPDIGPKTVTRMYSSFSPPVFLMLTFDI